jgi:tetratricopeptide (TPR) repeat protein
VKNAPANEVTATNTTNTASSVPDTLENAVVTFEKKIQNGSAAALNQIASAYYTLGEVWEKRAQPTTKSDPINTSNSASRKGQTTATVDLGEAAKKAEVFYKKATIYFCKAAEAGCKEAVYNAGLSFSKLQKFDKAAVFYRQCIKNDEDSPLALKAAVNLAILILEKHIEKDNDELQQLVKIGQKNTGKRAETLLQTTVIILTDMNSEGDSDDGTAEQALQPKVFLTAGKVSAQVAQ